MVLKILKPPRNKDSLGSLTGQSIGWVFNVSRRGQWVMEAYSYYLFLAAVPHHAENPQTSMRARA